MQVYMTMLLASATRVFDKDIEKQLLAFRNTSNPQRASILSTAPVYFSEVRKIIELPTEEVLAKLTGLT